MIKVYLNDWLFNAGIVGFLKINSHLWQIKNNELLSLDENLLKFGDNFIEFDNEIFKRFSKRFFDFAFNQYGRYNNVIEIFKNFIDDLNNNLNEESLEEKKQEIFDKFKKILTGFSLLKRKLGNLPSKKKINLIETIEKAIKILKDEEKEFWESDVQIYLRKIYGQKSFLNLSVNKDRFEKFINEFEKPLVEGIINKDKKYFCIFCGERYAKKNTFFDTGISKFYGLNADVVNFSWNFNPKLPLCEICEIIYFCYFAGLTELKKDNKTLYYFVNSDASINELIRQNLLFEKTLNSNLDDNVLINFFTELFLQASIYTAKYTLQNIALIELNLLNKLNQKAKKYTPKVISFNISKEKAEFLLNKNNKDKLNKFSKKFYSIKDFRKSILFEIMDLILTNKLYYGYLNKLLKIFIAHTNNSKFYETNINPYLLQELNILIINFISQVMGGNKMNISEKELWQIYHRGIDLSRTLKEKKAENKIQSISYKLLNSLRIGNINQFMDILIRTYMAYGKEIPSSFVKAVSDKDAFYSLGYSFLNGLLGKKEGEG